MSLSILLQAADGTTNTIIIEGPNIISNSVSSQFGQTTILSAPDNGNGDLLVSQQITLPNNNQYQVQSLSFYITEASGNLTLGLYNSNNSGMPGSLIIQTTPFPTVNGWNTQTISSSPVINAGIYYLAYLPSNNNLSFTKENDTGVAYFTNYSFGTLPNTFPSNPETNITNWSFYGTFLEIPIPVSNTSSNTTSNTSFNISSDRLYPWNPGVTYNGGITNRTTIYKTLTPLGNSQDDMTQIQAAISSCPNGQVVLLSANTFTVNTNNVILMANNITLRGAGAGQTIINKVNGGGPRSNTVAPYTDGLIYEPNGNGYIVESAYPIISFSQDLFSSTNNDLLSVDLTTDGEAGSNSITISNTSNFNVGQYVLIDELTNSSWQPCNIPADEDGTTANSFSVWGGDRVTYNIHYPTLIYEDDCDGSNATNPYDTTQSPGAPAVPGGYAPYVTVDYSRYDRLTNEIKEITAIDGNVVSFSTPLSISYRVSHTAQLTPYTGDTTPIVNSGIESITFIGGGDGAIWLGGAYNWVKGVEITNWLGIGIEFLACFRCELRDSYIHTGSWPVPGGGGYAVGFEWASSECLIENCITIDTCKNIVAQAAGAGCVVGYNYFDDAWDADEGVEAWQEVCINGSHLAGPHHILFEGNYGFNFDSDYTHGGSNYHMAFRNVLSGKRRDFTDTVATGGGNLRTIGLAAYSWWFTFVGNVLGYDNPDIINWNYDDPAMTANNNSWSSNGDIWKIGYDPERWDAAPEPNTISTMIRTGNYDFLTNTQQFSNNTIMNIPNSLYVNSAPSCFGNTYIWPWSNPSNGAVYILPAKARFDANTPNIIQ